MTDYQLPETTPQPFWEYTFSPMTGCCPPALTEGITQVLISFVTLLNLVRKLLSGSLAMTAMTHVLFPKTR